MKRRSVLLLLSVLLLGGCMTTKQEEPKERSAEENKQVMLDYMRNKYNEDFEVISSGKTVWFGRDLYASMYAKSDEHKNMISVDWHFRESGETITDNYANLLFKFPLNDMMDKVVEEHFHDFKYATYSKVDRVQFSEYSGETLLETMKTTEMTITTYILMDESAQGMEASIKESIVALNDRIKTQSSGNVHLMIDVYVCENPNFEENEILAKQYKEMYSITGEDLTFTFNNYDRNILKRFYYSGSTVGVEERDS